MADETKVDLLNNETIAGTIMRLLRECFDRLVTVSVYRDRAVGNQVYLKCFRHKKEEDILSTPSSMDGAFMAL